MLLGVAIAIVPSAKRIEEETEEETEEEDDGVVPEPKSMGKGSSRQLGSLLRDGQY